MSLILKGGKMASKRPKGSIINKIVIVLLAAALIATILYPKYIWEKQEEETQKEPEEEVMTNQPPPGPIEPEQPHSPLDTPVEPQGFSDEEDARHEDLLKRLEEQTGLKLETPRPKKGFFARIFKR